MQAGSRRAAACDSSGSAGPIGGCSFGARVLLMVTLGIYRFWLATDVRRFLWSNTEIAGETLEYTGTALELLLGFLIAIAILIPVYAGFFLAALDLGMIGKLSGVIAFAALGVLGQYAIYRARRYRLTRTIYRGLRFHQEGSAWAYRLPRDAVVDRHRPHFRPRLSVPARQPRTLQDAQHFLRRPCRPLRGVRLCRCSCAACRCGCWCSRPLALAVVVFVGAVDWTALADALAQGGDDVMSKIEGGNPGLGGAIVFAMLMAAISVTMAALLYPAFQAMVLRWWSSGLALWRH